MATKAQTSKRGFASMDSEKAQEIRRLGGQTVHKLGKAHTFTLEEAREAGKKGGRATSRKQAHMAEISRKGVNARRRRAKAKDHTEKEA
jgi:general stress protein YciG